MDGDSFKYFVSLSFRIAIATIAAIAVIGFCIGVACGQDGYYPEDRGETLAEERARIDAQKTRFAYIPQKQTAAQFDGICRLTVEGKQWSGVAISTTQILPLPTITKRDLSGLSLPRRNMEHSTGLAFRPRLSGRANWQTCRCLNTTAHNGRQLRFTQ